MKNISWNVEIQQVFSQDLKTYTQKKERKKVDEYVLISNIIK